MKRVRSKFHPSSFINLLSRTLAIAFGLFGVNAFHAVEDVFGVGALDAGFGRAGLVTAGAGHRVGGQLAAPGFVGLKEVHGNGWLLLSKLESQTPQMPCAFRALRRKFG